MRQFLVFSLVSALCWGCGGSVGSGGAAAGSKDPGDCPCDTTTACVESCLCDVECVEVPPSDDSDDAVDLGGDSGGDDGAGGGGAGDEGAQDDDPIDIPGSEDADDGGGAGAGECSGACNTDGECDPRCGGNGICVSTNGERTCQPGPAGGGGDAGGGGGGGGGGLPGGGEIPQECFTDCASTADCTAECGAGWSCQGFGGFGVCLPDGFV